MTLREPCRKLDGLTPQKRWRLKMRRLGRCSKCGHHQRHVYRTFQGKVKTSPHCKRCFDANRKYQRKHYTEEYREKPGVVPLRDSA